MLASRMGLEYPGALFFGALLFLFCCRLFADGWIGLRTGLMMRLVRMMLRFLRGLGLFHFEFDIR